jgi:hypothetical protein
LGTVNQNTSTSPATSRPAARTGGEITIDHPIGDHR